jgi:hypothetical protein
MQVAVTSHWRHLVKVLPVGHQAEELQPAHSEHTMAATGFYQLYRYTTTTEEDAQSREMSKA